jgi:hypothetical protein
MLERVLENLSSCVGSGPWTGNKWMRLLLLPHLQGTLFFFRYRKYLSGHISSIVHISEHVDRKEEQIQGYVYFRTLLDYKSIWSFL